MTGNPQLTERQQTFLRQAEKCRESASNLRAWKGPYDQNCPNGCILPHLGRMQIRHSYDSELGIERWWELVGFTRDYETTMVSIDNRCVHDGTPAGAASWLEQHALELEAQV